MKNPFTALGLIPESLVGLDDEQIFALVRARYIALAKLYYPDSGAIPDPQKFGQVRSAFAELDRTQNEASFSEWKSRVIKAPKESKDAKQKRILREREDYICTSMLDYWTAGVFPESIRHPARSLARFNEPAWRMVLYDSLAGSLRSAGNNRQPTNFLGFFASAFPYELECTADGRWYRHELKQRLFNWKRGAPPAAVPPIWVQRTTKGPGSKFLARTGKSLQLPPLTIIGSLDPTGFDSQPVSQTGPFESQTIRKRFEDDTRGGDYDENEAIIQFERSVFNRLFHSRGPGELSDHLARGGGFTRDEFGLFINRLSPYVRDSRQLIALSFDQPEPEFHILGNPQLQTLLRE